MSREQKLICIEHRTMFPADIIGLEGMQGVTKRQVRDYLHRASPSAASRILANQIESYIETHGIPLEHVSVLSYIKHLKTAVEDND